MIDCRSCATPLTLAEQVSDLGVMRYPGLVKPGEEDQVPAALLALLLCPSCGLLQLSQHCTDPLGDERDEPMFAELALADLETLVERTREIWSSHGLYASTWLDISAGMWSGVLEHAPGHIHRTAVGASLAAEKFRHLASMHTDRIVPDKFGPHYFDQGSADIVTTAGVLGTLDEELDEFVAGIAQVLEPQHGLWMIQEPYALAMLLNHSADAITHSQASYFTVTALRALLARHGLEANDVTYSSYMGGSVRVAVSRKARRGISASVMDALEAEHQKAAGDPAVWRAWSEDAYVQLGSARKVINQACAKGETVYAYGTGERGSTLLQMAGLDRRVLPFTLDEDPEAAGLVMASTGIPVVAASRLAIDKPAAVLVLPWYFRGAIIEREQEYLQAGGRMVFPFPDCEVVSFE